MAKEGTLDLPGIGPKLTQRLERELGGREGLHEALDRGDVAALSRVPGISQDRAVRLVKAYRGDAVDWLRTDDARELAREALAPLLDRAVTDLGRAKLLTLAPARTADELDDRLAHARDQLDRLTEVDLDPVVDALRSVSHPTQPNPSPERDVTILVEPGETLDALRDEGLDRWADVVTEGDMVDGSGLVIAATMGQAPRGAVQRPGAAAHELVPFADAAWAENNRNLLEALSQLAPLLDVEDHASPVLQRLGERDGADEVDLEDVARGCVEEANATIEAEIEDVTISGSDVLEVLQGGTSKTVEELVSEAHQEARERFQDATGLIGAPFTDEYPIEVDPGALRRLERERRQDLALDRHREAARLATTVREHRDGVQAMVEAALELDRWQAVTRAALELGLSVPERGDQLRVENALHLDLAGEGEPVDYPVPQGVSLLTGANSGGKTTLLETLGQVACLAHLGLPVPAEHATVPLLDGLAYYERPRQLGAGAFEGFLRTIEEVLLSGEHVLVLADELEAMTELEAASAILAEVVARLDERDAPAVLVTHLAPYILEHVDARTDGIEAKGLDEDNQLVVDRTPALDLVARSTPELILQRLRNEASGERQGLYDSMLARLEGSRDT